MLTELKNRGVIDILIAYVEDLKGFEEAISDWLGERQKQYDKRET